VNAVVAVEVEAARGELESEFPGAIAMEPDGAGGAYMGVEGIELGERWSAARSTLTFHVPYNYPAASPYPYYLPADCAPKGAWPAALQQVHWRDREMIQVSLRHNNWDPERDRVLGCVLQVAAFLRSV
jgi:hypothetical protein